jgi:hypothetical protein
MDDVAGQSVVVVVHGQRKQDLQLQRPQRPQRQANLDPTVRQNMIGTGKSLVLGEAE